MAIEIATDAKLDRDVQRVIDTVAALVMVAVLVAVPLAFWRFSDAPTGGWAPYWVSCAIGVSVGMTELIGRYRDSPFAPLFTVPGILYCAINGAAAWLAYHLIQAIPIPMPSETAAVLTAGI